ncbi:hypothetical protein GPECTOR_59g671 [Gonium pectorale]|uniref:Uncharacterized protein n=1 Tax=Gonium pectorale TaxID=33097 RepID=A0A150G5C8_GONPE|nr:hypothetical protein GPECTOR_59g671 [Gonium pectorale]|eukprot:KXZ45062.1 hypothetical protein GPECTOR_59g671 [Gonium pectorale]
MQQPSTVVGGSGGAATTKAAVKHIHIYDTRVTAEYLESNPAETNRLLMAYGPEPFAVVHFDVRFGSRKEACGYMKKASEYEA